MAKTVIVEQGDCLVNLSQREGFYWETIWNHSQNSTLRKRRKHLNIIKKGDELFIPDRELKEVPCATEQVHRFVLKGASVRFTLTLLDRGQPRGNERYILSVNGRSQEGTTDENGRLDEAIPADASEGLLLLGDKQEKFTINFGYVDPVDEISGVKTRLQNLGFYSGEIDDELTPETVTAIAEFQRSVNLSGEGQLSAETRSTLLEAHGS